MVDDSRDGTAASDEDPTTAVPPIRATENSAQQQDAETQVVPAVNPYRAPAEPPTVASGDPQTTIDPAAASTEAPVAWDADPALTGYPPPTTATTAPAYPPPVAPLAPAWNQAGYAPVAFPGAPPGYRPVVQTSNNAVAALVLSIGSWLICPVIPAIVALVFAGKASRDINASNGWLTGSAMVTWARVLSWLNIAAVVAFAVAMVVILAVAGSVEPPPSEFST